MDTRRPQKVSLSRPRVLQKAFVVDEHKLRRLDEALEAELEGRFITNSSAYAWISAAMTPEGENYA